MVEFLYADDMLLNLSTELDQTNLLKRLSSAMIHVGECAQRVAGWVGGWGG